MKKKSASQKKIVRSRLDRNDGNIAAPYGATRLPYFRPLVLAVPDKMFTRLKYSGFGNATINVGSIITTRRYRPTAVYDVDPSLGSTATPGFAELAALYGSYRVARSHIKLQVSPCNSNGLSLVVLPLNVDPGSSPSNATVQSWPMNPYAKYKLLAGTGGPVSTIQHVMSTEQIFGSKAVYFDDNFASLVSTNPINNWYWVIGFINNSTVSGSAIQIGFLTEIEMDVEFFNRTELLS